MPKVTQYTRNYKNAVRNIANLAKRRTQLGLTRFQLAKKAGLAHVQIINYECDGYMPNVGNYNKLAKVLGWELIPNVLEKDMDLDAKSLKRAMLIQEALKNPKFNTGEDYVLFYGSDTYPVKFMGQIGDKFQFKNINGGWTITLSAVQTWSLIAKKGESKINANHSISKRILESMESNQQVHDR